MREDNAQKVYTKQTLEDGFTLYSFYPALGWGERLDWYMKIDDRVIVVEDDKIQLVDASLQENGRTVVDQLPETNRDNVVTPDKIELHSTKEQEEQARKQLYQFAVDNGLSFASDNRCYFAGQVDLVDGVPQFTRLAVIGEPRDNTGSFTALSDNYVRIIEHEGDK